MKFIRFFGILFFLIPCISWAASSSDFQNASRLLSAARRGDTRTVQILINNGADVNYVDSTGLSLVCTAVMNNDTRAIQILQMYGADASNCDRQIKNYRQKNRVATRGKEYGFFSGLSSSHVLLLSAVGVAAVIGGVALLTDAFDAENNNYTPSSGGSHSGSGSGGSGGSTTPSTNKLFAQNLPYGPACSGTSCPTDFTTWQDSDDFTYMSDISTQNTFNYLMVARAYNAFVRGYLGMGTIRITNDLAPFDLSSLPFAEGSIPGGGKPVNVALITGSGVNATGSAMDGLSSWLDASKISQIQAACASGTTSTECQTAVNAALKTSHKYYNLSGELGETPVENTTFDLVNGTTVFGSATNEDTKLAKIIAGWEGDERTNPDFYGFIPNGQLTVYKVGTGATGVADYKNYAAIFDALQLKDATGNYVANVVANLALPSESFGLSYATVDGAKILYDAATTAPLKTAVFAGLVDNYYNLNTGDDSTVNKPSQDMTCAFSGCAQTGNVAAVLKNPVIIVNSVGRSLYGLGESSSLSPQVATFENFAPVVYSGLQNLFMSVVAVKPNATTGTADLTVDEYNASGAGKLELSTWTDPNDSSITYSSRMCGLAGTGNGGTMNPWCFAAPGTTDLEAAAAMAGSVALVKSAFDYMTPQQMFLLLALTADGPYLGTNPGTNLAWASKKDLIAYLQNMYSLPANLDASDAQYLESFKTAFGYGMINLERATRPNTNVYFYSSDKNTIVSASGNAFWRNAISTPGTSRASTVLNSRGTIRTSFYDVLESPDGSISLPRVWNMEYGLNNDVRRGLYMGDVLAEFAVDATNKHSNKIGNMTFDMAMSPRAYNDNLNGLDNLSVSFVDEKYEFDAGYQRYLTDGHSRFDGRANGILALVSNGVTSGAKYKFGNFAFGANVFSGAMSDENLLDKDPIVSAQFEPARLGLANGGAAEVAYNKDDMFGFNISFGSMHETNTVLGAINDGLLSLNGANTQYVDAVANYKPYEKMNLFARATFATTRANIGDGIISNVSDIKSNAFALGADMGGFNFTAAMPLAVVDGRMGYDYADFAVTESDGKYSVVMNNPHIEYIDLSTQKREYRFSGSYKRALGEFTDAGFGFIYRVNPGNTDVFGNETIMMFKIHHRLGI